MSGAWSSRALLLSASLVVVGCGASCDPGNGGADGGTPLFPGNYAQTYTEVRDCRSSGDHDLNRIRILASPEALAPYQSRDGGFPPGAVVLKEEYDFADTDCAGEIIQWTVMKRLADGGSPATLDWEWQKVEAEGVSVETSLQPCIACHSGCGRPPEGYEATCALP